MCAVSVLCHPGPPPRPLQVALMSFATVTLNTLQLWGRQNLGLLFYFCQYYVLQVYFFQTFKILETLPDLQMNNRAAQDYDDHSRGLAMLEKVLG